MALLSRDATSESVLLILPRTVEIAQTHERLPIGAERDHYQICQAVVVTTVVDLNVVVLDPILVESVESARSVFPRVMERSATSETGIAKVHCHHWRNLSEVQEREVAHEQTMDQDLRASGIAELRLLPSGVRVVDKGRKMDPDHQEGSSKNDQSLREPLLLPNRITNGAQRCDQMLQHQSPQSHPEMEARLHHLLLLAMLFQLVAPS